MFFEDTKCIFLADSDHVPPYFLQECFYQKSAPVIFKVSCAVEDNAPQVCPRVKGKPRKTQGKPVEKSVVSSFTASVGSFGQLAGKKPDWFWFKQCLLKLLNLVDTEDLNNLEKKLLKMC